ncbi:hypothetical protein FOXG_20118 [Fusarium oxysporum f. sp. lycopersici 4287]|uniref:Uncharacterized protein n=1 Tax=Fusarium oxysporum f. sp. lycopersici (strain 4287 / CBS 123668 / FGSC 9935 / NRRL 34936) TaxID=426428 RepID=A0A0J9VD76_FUSO4|nr:hypothetical protein FOXG_20118 [Fusarium oxysporum f. sp. lycopersici 4287]KNB08980.1 hypothetical protein FOXG_20118 [Fusarium oxysporum f. sp. lycopersici 4287]
MRRTRSILNVVYVQSLAPKRFSFPKACKTLSRKELRRAFQTLQETNNAQIHPTGSNHGQSTNKTHAKNDGQESILPKKVQEKVPESVERAVPNAIHDTGDTPVKGVKK